MCPAVIFVHITLLECEGLHYKGRSITSISFISHLILPSPPLESQPFRFRAEKPCNWKKKRLCSMVLGGVFPRFGPYLPSKCSVLVYSPENHNSPVKIRVLIIITPTQDVLWHINIEAPSHETQWWPCWKMGIAVFLLRFIFYNLHLIRFINFIWFFSIRRAKKNGSRFQERGWRPYFFRFHWKYHLCGIILLQLFLLLSVVPIIISMRACSDFFLPD